jgi:hypothetical protein
VDHSGVRARVRGATSHLRRHPPGPPSAICCDAAVSSNQESHPLVKVLPSGRKSHVEKNGRALCEVEWTDAGRPPSAVNAKLRGKQLRSIGRGSPSCALCARLVRGMN